MNSAVSVGEAEALEAGTERRSRWPLVILPAAALVIAAVWCDQVAVDSARRELASASQQVEEQGRSGAAELAGLVAYAGPGLSSGSVPAPVRDGLVLMLRTSADDSATTTVGVVPPPPLVARWHPEIAAQWEQVRSRADEIGRELERTALQYSLSTESSPAYEKERRAEPENACRLLHIVVTLTHDGASVNGFSTSAQQLVRL